jgi:hypothetical protein
LSEIETVKEEVKQRFPKRTRFVVKRRKTPEELIRQAEAIVHKKFPVKPKVYTYHPQGCVPPRRHKGEWAGASEVGFQHHEPKRIIVVIPESSYAAGGVVKDTVLAHELTESLHVAYNERYRRMKSGHPVVEGGENNIDHRCGLKAEKDIIKKYNTTQHKVAAMEKEHFNKEYACKEPGKKKKVSGNLFGDSWLYSKHI